LQKEAMAVGSGEDIINKLFPISKPQEIGMSSRAKGCTKWCVPSRGIPLRPAKIHNISKEEREIFNLLKSEPLHFDEIVRKIGKPTSQVGALLSLMEIKGMVKNREGEYSI